MQNRYRCSAPETCVSPLNTSVFRARCYRRRKRLTLTFSTRGGVSDSASQPRLNTVLLTLFAVTAVMLVVIGLYGMLSQLVAEKTPEIGLRLALGARPAQVLGHVIRQSAWVTGVGVAVGLAGAIALARFMTTMVFGVS